MKRIIGIDIGRTKCTVVYGNYYEGTVKVINKLVFLTEADYDTLKQAMERFDELLDMYDFESIGIGCRGSVDTVNGILLDPPNMPEWKGLRIKDHFTNRYSVPCFLNSNSEISALAELYEYNRKGRDFRSIIYLSLIPDVSAGIIKDKKLDVPEESGTLPILRDTADINELICDLKNSPENIPDCSALRGFVDKPASITLDTVLRFAEQNDCYAVTVAEKIGSMIADALITLNERFSPEAVVLDDFYDRYRTLLDPLIKKKLKASDKSSGITFLPPVSRENIIDTGVLINALPQVH